ncbi:MAG: TIGR04053 family radical SAM/SPASM domain-containing protein [Candidatus Riflebacteria bacterium]|nr:TIGR04053 family radical SAM/SPASM domain-containing protein [Candidatus Riflebacteria bacterium]
MTHPHSHGGPGGHPSQGGGMPDFMDGRINFDERPILVFWESTRACLLSCQHCRASAIEQALPGELSTDEAKRFIDSLDRFGEPLPVLIMTGGDPLMRSDLVELIEHARARGIPVGLSPAVTPRLTPQTAARMRELGVKAASISLDGARAETHERIRGVNDHFARTLEALRLLVSLGYTLQVNTTIMRDNVEELAALAKILKDIGVRIWEVFFLIHVGRGSEMRELDPTQTEDVCHFLYDVSRYGIAIRTVEGPFFRRVCAWRLGDAPGTDPQVRYGLSPLYGRLNRTLVELLGPPSQPPAIRSARTRDGKGIVFVAHDGEIFPAGFLPLALGNVRTSSLVDVYRDSPLLQAVRKASFGGRCGACEFADLCGGSRARAYAAFGDPLAEDPACIYRPPNWKETPLPVDTRLEPVGQCPAR